MASDDLTQHLENGNLARILGEFAALRGAMGAVDSKLDELSSRVAVIETRQTRPVWVAELNNRIDDLGTALRSEINDLGSSLRSEMEKGFSGLEDKMDLINGTC